MTTGHRTGSPLALTKPETLQPSGRLDPADHATSRDSVPVRLANSIGRVLHARVVRALEDVMKKHPDLIVACMDNRITIPAPVGYGFSMSIATDLGRCRVLFGEWSDDFASVKEAVSLIEDALSGDVRLRVDIFDAHDTRWFLERRLPDGSWIEQPRSGSPSTSPSHAQAMQTVYLHNDFGRIDWNSNG